MDGKVRSRLMFSGKILSPALCKVYPSLGSDLNDVDTLECSNPARRLLVSVVAQTELPIAVVAPTINLQKTKLKKTQQKFL